MEELGADGVAAVVCLCFIVADYATGVAKAVHAKQLDSTKMREGLWHKGGFIGAMVLGYGCQALVNLGFLPDSFSAIFGGVCVWVMLTEAISIFENLCQISPELAESPLAALLKLKEGTKNDN